MDRYTIKPLEWHDTDSQSMTTTVVGTLYADDSQWRVLGYAMGDCDSVDHGKQLAEVWYREKLGEALRGIENTPPVELPEPGDVWGVPGRKETRRFVIPSTVPDTAAYVSIDDEYQEGVRSRQTWVRESGAVRIDGEGERVKELEAELAATEDGRREMIAKSNKLRDTCDELRTKLAALERQYQACEDTVTTWFERCQGLEAEIARLREEVRLLREGAKCNWWAWQGDDDHLESLTCPVLIRSSDLRAIVGERDDARAAVGRLLEALREIDSHTVAALQGLVPRDAVQECQRMAREAIQKEEGVKP